MNETKKYSSKIKNKKERSRDKENEREKKDKKLFNKSLNNLISEDVKKMHIKIKYIHEINRELTTEDAIKKYDDDNFLLLEKLENEEKANIYDNIQKNILLSDNKNNYSSQIINLINNIKKSNIAKDLPKLPYGKCLSDEEFLSLLQDCISYANYNLEEKKLEKMKKQLIEQSMNNLKNIFNYPQITKSILQNALITVLTTDNKEDYMDNFNLLGIKHCTITPFIKLDFNGQKLDKKELIDIFCTHVYIKNFKKTLNKFIINFKEKVPNDRKLKDYIKNYFFNHNIYFCVLPEKITALTIHTGDIYIKAKYLKEYYEKNNEEIIKEKIILHIAHELNHVLIREISDEMGTNFLLKSKYKNNKNNNSKIKFINKFNDSIYHLMDINESGNVFDYNFFNQYYFDNLYEKEAKFFSEIKNIQSIGVFKNKLNEIILEEKDEQPLNDSVNKFKKIEEEPRRCISSRILGIVNKNDIDKDDYKLSDDSDYED